MDTATTTSRPVDEAIADDHEGRGAPAGFAHIPALDGLRGVAVLAVVAFHANWDAARGGFLGVDIFFVLSGFLITSLLLTEKRKQGSVSLTHFWARRARRLLPALGLLFIALIVYAALNPTDPTLTSLRGDMLAGIGYVANWRFVLSGASYFANAAPSPLRHLWSLAIEEQFYLVWPIIFLVVVRLRRAAVATILVLAVVSALVMWALYRSGDPSRVYYGTDTHVHGLLLGAALAFVPIRPSRWLSAAGVVAALGAAITLFSLDSASATVYRGGLLAFELLIVVVIAACAQPRKSFVGTALSFRPLRAIGLISYGLYLWHWPVFTLCDQRFPTLSEGALVVTKLALTLALTLFSYFVVELPFRRGALRGRSMVLFVPATVGAIVAGLLLVSASLDSPITYAAEAARHQDLSLSREHPGRPRAMLVGDSTAFTLAPGLAQHATDAGIEFVNASHAGCTLDWDVDGIRHANVWAPRSQKPECRWPTAWPKLVRRYRPDRVLVMFGPGDVGDLREGDRVLRYDTKRWRRRVERSATQAIETLHRAGAQVGLILSPGLLIGKSVNPLNRLLTSVAKQSGVPTLDLGPIVNPGGTRYRWDGVHYSRAGADETGAAITRWLQTLPGAH